MVQLSGIKLQLQAIWQFSILYSSYQILLVSLVLFASATKLIVPSPWFMDFIRSISIVVAFAWIFMYIFIGPSEVSKYYEARLLPKQSKYLKYAIRIADVFVHILPVIILGLPSSYGSLFVATFMMLFWYVVTRPFIVRVLKEVPVRFTDLLFYVMYPVLLSIIVILRFVTKKV